MVRFIHSINFVKGGRYEFSNVFSNSMGNVCIRVYFLRWIHKGGNKVRKISKVINQYTERQGFSERVIGECERCGAEVRRHAKGFDEECPECYAELDWSVEE